MTNRLVASFRNWRKNRVIDNELMRLSPRELQDVGIARIGIPGVARESTII